MTNKTGLALTTTAVTVFLALAVINASRDDNVSPRTACDNYIQAYETEPDLDASGQQVVTALDDQTIRNLQQQLSDATDSLEARFPGIGADLGKPDITADQISALYGSEALSAAQLVGQVFTELDREIRAKCATLPTAES